MSANNAPPSSSNAMADLAVAAGMEQFGVGSMGSGTGETFCFV